MKSINTNDMILTIKDHPVGTKVVFVDGSYTLSLDKESGYLGHRFLGREKVEGVIVELGNYPKDIKDSEGDYRLGNRYKIKDGKGNLHYANNYNLELIT